VEPLVTAAIVAHPDRSPNAQRLIRVLSESIPTVGEPIPTMIFMDNENLGCHDNHVRAWDWLLCQTSPWLMVLEDDALPIPEFTEQLPLALQHAPSPVVSLYLGRTRPAYYQRRIAHALVGCSHPGADEPVDDSTPWVVADRLLHCVGVVMRHEVVEQMMPYLPEMVALKHAIDEGITEFCRMQSIPVSYTVPSLVDHADGESLAVHSRPWINPIFGERVAWAVGGRESWDSTFRIM
jgi:hypothetical protein